MIEECSMLIFEYNFLGQVGISQAEQEEERDIKIVEEEPRLKQKRWEQGDFHYC